MTEEEIYNIINKELKEEINKTKPIFDSILRLEVLEIKNKNNIKFSFGMSLINNEKLVSDYKDIFHNNLSSIKEKKYNINFYYIKRMDNPNHIKKYLKKNNLFSSIINDFYVECEHHIMNKRNLKWVNYLINHNHSIDSKILSKKLSII